MLHGDCKPIMQAQIRQRHGIVADEFLVGVFQLTLGVALVEVQLHLQTFIEQGSVLIHDARQGDAQSVTVLTIVIAL